MKSPKEEETIAQKSAATVLSCWLNVIMKFKSFYLFKAMVIIFMSVVLL